MWCAPLQLVGCCICSPVWWGFTGMQEWEALEGIIRRLHLILPPHLRLSAIKWRLVSFLVFCETLVMFCINCCRQLSILFTPCGLDLITVNSLDFTLCPRNVSLGCYINNIVSNNALILICFYNFACMYFARHVQHCAFASASL